MALHSTRIIATHALSARTAANNRSAVLALDDLTEALIFIVVTAISGAGATLVVDYDVNDDGGADWATHGSSAAITATGSYLLKLTNLGKFASLNGRITGAGPSVTFRTALIGKD